ncbi:MAG: capsular exopolysaccharide synthesis family protein [Akkermansiaceae bacterium]|jgi:capsular exopolysaccharide synthesis family protein
MQGNNNFNKEAGSSIDYWQIVKNRYGVILLTFLLVFMTSAVITSVMPRKFESTSVVQVHPSMIAISPIGRSGGANPGAMPTRNYMENEFETIIAAETLRMAAEEINLPTRWGMEMEAVIDNLKNIVQTDPRRGTDFIEITVRHAKPDDAKEIADAVSVAYMTRRKKNEVDRAERALEALDGELIAQSDLVQDNRKDLTVLIQQYGIPYFDGGNSNPLGATEESMFHSAKRQLAAFETSRDQIKIQIKNLVDMPSEDLIRYAAGLDLPENQVTYYYTNHRASLEMRTTMVAQGLGPKHPDMIAVEERAKGAMELARKEATSLKAVLSTKLELINLQVERMGENVIQRKDDTVELSLKQHTYNSAKEVYQQSRMLLREMKFKQTEARVLLKMPRDPITLHEKPKRAKSAVFPNITMNLLLGAGVGLIFGIGIAFLLEHLDTSVKCLEDVERYLEVPVLAVIPQDVGLLHKQSGMSPDAEAYRILRTNIEFNRKNPEDNSITVVSGGAGEGKSTTVSNLAYVCAQGGYTTLMIDADLRRPRLHTFFDINNSVGLTNYLTTDLALEDVILQTPVDNLYFLPSGILPADAAGILNSRRMSELLQDVKQRFDLVLVDSPPILGVSDAAVLASEVDLTIVVVQHRKLPRNMLIRVKQAVENVGGHVIGVVLNNVDVRSDSQYQYYTSYYTYYAPTNMEENPAPQQMTSHKSTVPEKGAGKAEDLY